MVESDNPCHTMGRTADHSVSNPPENRIKTSAVIPSDRTSDGLSNEMTPRPSDPANMPMARNKTSEGMPNRFESLIVKMLRMTRRGENDEGHINGSRHRAGVFQRLFDET